MEKRGEGLGMGCGPLLDNGVHVFILDTRNYQEFCAKNLGFLGNHTDDGDVVVVVRVQEQHSRRMQVVERRAKGP
ncbi:hypothetical protein ACWGRV_42505 [Streptomyces sp. NPDC055663]